jgi:LCP family protein required for cell wall assembly
MRAALLAARRVVVRVAVLGALFLAVPDGAVHPTTISLTTIGTAKAVDPGSDVLWVLVLGSEATPGTDVLQGRTDAIQLIGVHWGGRRSVAIGLPRDLYVDLPEGRGRISQALELGGPEGAAQEVEDLLGITPDLVLVAGFDGFLSTMGAVGDVVVESPVAFTTDDGGVEVRRGRNTLDAEQALSYVTTRDTLPLSSDYERVANHQLFLVGLLERLRSAEDDEGFMEATTLAALAGLETDLSPAAAYRIVQALTTIAPERTTGCIIRGTPSVEFGAEVLIPDEAQAAAVGADAADDVRLQGGCRDGSG